MPMSRTRLFLTSALLLTGMACASSPSTSAVKVRDASPDLITSVEIANTPVTNAYDLVNRLRPRWLQGQALGSIGAGGRGRTQIIGVYLDGARMGGLESLRGISATGITTLQYYDATRAATVLRDPGSEPLAGAIIITTSRLQ